MSCVALSDFCKLKELIRTKLITDYRSFKAELLSQTEICVSNKKFTNGRMKLNEDPEKKTGRERISNIDDNCTIVKGFIKEDCRLKVHESFSSSKKFKTQPSAHKPIFTVFWYSAGLLLCDSFEVDTTINSDSYCKTLQKMHTVIRLVKAIMIT